tara:strand:- start:599 stop:1054 length:456 start_codon:yes stop_codon:yes gene_type:complete
MTKKEQWEDIKRFIVDEYDLGWVVEYPGGDRQKVLKKNVIGKPRFAQPSVIDAKKEVMKLHAELIQKVEDMKWNKSCNYVNNIRGDEEWFQHRKTAWKCYRLRNIKKNKQGHNKFHALYHHELYNWAKLNNLKVRKNMKYRELATIIYRNT